MSPLNDTTSIYPMIQAQVCPVPTVKVPDLNPDNPAGERNRKRAAYCSVAIVNELEGHSDPIILQGEMPQFFIDGDNLTDVKNRLFEELEEVFKNAQDVLDGKVTIEELRQNALEEHAAEADAGETLTDTVKEEVSQ
mgnify:CR=1 FL=1